MSHVRHHILSVTSFDHDRIIKARHRADKLFFSVSPLMTTQINNFYTFVVNTSGSKVGWREQKEFDDKIKAFKQWMSTQNIGDGGEYLEFVDVKYGECEG